MQKPGWHEVHEKEWAMLVVEARLETQRKRHSPLAYRRQTRR